jgi:hypothetical protein
MIGISQIRYQQQYRQLRATIAPGVGDITTYTSRDVITGLRQVQTADGGVATAKYISNSVLSGTIALTIPSAIGLTGYISQKPY